MATNKTTKKNKNKNNNTNFYQYFYNLQPMATIYKQKKILISTVNLKIPCLTTSLKCKFSKIIYYYAPRSLEEPLFQITRSYVMTLQHTLT